VKLTRLYFLVNYVFDPLSGAQRHFLASIYPSSTFYFFIMFFFYHILIFRFLSLFCRLLVLLFIVLPAPPPRGKRWDRAGSVDLYFRLPLGRPLRQGVAPSPTNTILHAPQRGPHAYKEQTASAPSLHTSSPNPPPTPPSKTAITKTQVAPQTRRGRQEGKPLNHPKKKFIKEAPPNNLILKIWRREWWGFLGGGNCFILTKPADVERPNAKLSPFPFKFNYFHNRGKPQANLNFMGSCAPASLSILSFPFRPCANSLFYNLVCLVVFMPTSIRTRAGKN
jgi:hypothetical protein